MMLPTETGAPAPTRDPDALASDLCAALLTPRDEPEMARLLADLCTPAEIRTLAERWHVARLLDGTDLSYREIHDATGVSTTTIVRVARFLREERNQRLSTAPSTRWGAAMLVDDTRLHIAVQKSGPALRLQPRPAARMPGLRIQNGKNALTARVENFPADLMFVRDDDIPTFVSDGVCEFGIVGEQRARGIRARARRSRASRWWRRSASAAARSSSPRPNRPLIEGPRSLEGARIATSYPRIVQRFLDGRRDRRDGGEDERRGRAGAAAPDRPLHLRPRLDRRDAGGERPSRGRDRVRKRGGADPHPEAGLGRKAEQGERLLSRIEGVLATKESKYIMLNAPGEALREITALLPGAEAPTILPLHGRPGHFAVHAVCQESVFWETLQKLKAAGASAILVLPIEKMMM